MRFRKPPEPHTPRLRAGCFFRAMLVGLGYVRPAGDGYTLTRKGQQLLAGPKKKDAPPEGGA